MEKEKKERPETYKYGRISPLHGEKLGFLCRIFGLNQQETVEMLIDVACEDKAELIDRLRQEQQNLQKGVAA